MIEDKPKNINFKENDFNFQIEGYVDSSLNQIGNFDNYLYSALSFLNRLPNYDFTKHIEKNKIVLPELKENKRTLILDLDETLLHTDLEFNFNEYDVILKVNLDKDESELIPTILRPYLHKFLEFAKENFEVILFTSSSKIYADEILKYLENKNKYFDHKIYRESCFCINSQFYIKDIRIIKNRRIEDMIIIDNSILSFMNNLNNGILVPSFYNNKKDNILECLIEFLKSNILNSKEDVTEILKRHFKYEELKRQLKVKNQKKIKL